MLGTEIAMGSRLRGSDEKSVKARTPLRTKTPPAGTGGVAQRRG